MKTFILKLLLQPIETMWKLVIGLLNIIPTCVYETFCRHGPGPRTDRNFFRPGLAMHKGSRRLHLGHALIAYTRGAIAKCCLPNENYTSKNSWWGVHTSDYQDIQSRW